MTTIMASIQPKWCALIANGKKTIEVRKSVPKGGVPFKVYIYCTKGEAKWLAGIIGKRPAQKLNGKVIGEFVCDGILSHCESSNADLAEQQGWIKREKLFEYANGKELYGWHISDLVIYDKPKELSEFVRECHETPNCRNCDYHWRDGKYTRRCRCYEHKPINRPPQSWFFVEE